MIPFIKGVLDYQILDIENELNKLDEQSFSNLFFNQDEEIVYEHLTETKDAIYELVLDGLSKHNYMWVKFVYFGQVKGKWYNSFAKLFKSTTIKPTTVEDKQILHDTVKPITLKPVEPLYVIEDGQIYHDTTSRNPFIDFDNVLSSTIKDQATVLREMEIEETELAKPFADRYTVDGVPLLNVIHNSVFTGTVDNLKQRVNNEARFVSEHNFDNVVDYVLTNKIAILSNVELTNRETAFTIWHYSKEYNIEISEVDLDDAIHALEDELYQSPIEPIEHLRDLMDVTFNERLIAEFESDMVGLQEEKDLS